MKRKTGWPSSHLTDGDTKDPRLSNCFRPHLVQTESPGVNLVALVPSVTETLLNPSLSQGWAVISLLQITVDQKAHKEGTRIWPHSLYTASLRASADTEAPPVCYTLSHTLSLGQNSPGTGTTLPCDPVLHSTE